MRRTYVRRFILSLTLAVSICLPALVGVLQASEEAAQPRPGGVDPRAMKFPPLNFQAPKVDRTVLPNGMVVYMLEDHLLPLINVTSAVRTGEIYVPAAEKAGLASLAGYVMRSGDAKKMTADEIDKALEYVAASVTVDVGRERGTASIFCLEKDLDSTVHIKKHINQWNVLLRHLGLERLNPDFYAVSVINFILGEEVR